MSELAMIIVFLVVVMFFKTSIRKGSKYVNQVIDTNIAEEQADLIERSMSAYDEVIERCGPDFKTPEEILNMLCKKNRRKPNNQQQQ